MHRSYRPTRPGTQCSADRVSQALLGAGRNGGTPGAIRRMSADIPNDPPMADAREETPMKDLVKQYLDQGLSRRQLMSGLSAIGMSTVAAKAVAQSLETFGQGGTAAPPSAVRGPAQGRRR